MIPEAFRILEHKRFGNPLCDDDIRTVVDAAADGSWGDAEIGAFLMAVAIHGMAPEETRTLTVSMLESGDQWDLAAEIPTLGDKHSTGGVGDKVSLILSPLLAACGRPVVMLTGRGLGHTGGTADKLESIPGLDRGLDRAGCLRALEKTGVAIGMPTAEIAPADGRLYALRDCTGTISSLPLITASILSKKLASGAAALMFDVKTGDGAFLVDREVATELARMLVSTARALGRDADALVTDMSQPLGRWVGHSSEVLETLECLEGKGPADLMEVTYALCEGLSAMTGPRLAREALEAAIASGKAREVFDAWALSQGADPAWVAQPSCPLAPVEVVIEARRDGVLATVANRRLGELLAGAGGGRLAPGGPIDMGVALRVDKKLGEAVTAGEPLARVYLRQADDAVVAALADCFGVADTGEAPPLIYDRISA